MSFRLPLTVLFLVALACATTSVRADRLVLAPDGGEENLPDLPNAKNAGPWDFQLAEKQAALGYDSPIEKWSAKVDHDLGLRPTLSVDYGRQLSSTFGAGVAYTRRDELSEIVLNGVYAPRPNLRLRIAGSQLRASPSYFGGGESSAIEQDSVLLGIRKYWRPDSFFSQAGLAAYSVRASAVSANTPGLDDPDMIHLNEMHAAGIAPGTMDGYTFNLSVRPAPLSLIELRRESSHLTYRLDSGKRQEDFETNRIAYSRFLENCTRLRGGYSTSDDTSRLELGMARSNWNITLAREQDNGSSATSVQVAYALPLGGGRHVSTSTCPIKPDSAPVFEPLVNTAVARPDQIPSTPVATSEE